MKKILSTLLVGVMVLGLAACSNDSENEATTSTEVSTELFDFVLTRLHEDAVYLPLTYECNKAIYTDELAGVGFTQSQYEIPFNTMYFN